MGRTANGLAKPKRPVAMWPSHPQELCRGVNDTWNSYQRANKGRTVTTAEWKSARAALWSEHEKLLSAVEVDVRSSSDSDGYVDDEPLTSPGMKRDYQAAAAPPPDLFTDPFEDSSDQFSKRTKFPNEWESGDYFHDCYDEFTDNFIIVAPDEGLY